MKKKIGFSGTVNIKLPILANEEITDCDYKIDSDNDAYKNEFVNIIKSDKDYGSIYVAILGLLFNDNEILNIRDMENTSSTRDMENTSSTRDMENTSSTNDNKIINYIIDTINDRNYDCFIDNGAFFINYSTEYVIDLFFDRLNGKKKKKIIYININDEKKIKTDEGVKDYNNEIFPKEELFIYYDHKHTVGVDIKQPFELSGLASISKFNKLTDTAQAIFRLRQLNYGHKINFIVNEDLNINSREELLKFLIIN